MAWPTPLLRIGQHGRFALVTVLAVWLALRFNLSKSSLDGLSSLHSSPTSVGKPRTLRPQDKWLPPLNWQATVPVYDNFPSINDEFAIGTRLLTSSTWTWPSLPRPFRTSPVDTLGTSTVTCNNSWGRLRTDNNHDQVWGYLGTSQTMAKQSFGSNEIVGFEQGTCYERYGRHGSYGLTSSMVSGTYRNWDLTDWSRLQEDCFTVNKYRLNSFPVKSLFDDSDSRNISNSTLVPRTAIVLRFHQHTKYTAEVKRNIRSIIEELALFTGAEYAVFLLVEVKDETRPIWDSSEAYARAIRDSVPREFQSMTVLWNTDKWKKEYPRIPEDMLDVHLSQWLPMQYFRSLYPEFAHYWNWEVDVRFTGHHYDLVKAAGEFSKAQPRKGLWERNSRLYIPRLHGSHAQFRDLVQSRYVTNHSDHSIWGPQLSIDRPNDLQASWLSELNSNPPGVGEEADLVTFLPLFDPVGTNYVWRDKFVNYEPNVEAEKVPRRATIITFVRLSSRLLQLMDLENKHSFAHHMSSEIWPHSLSLQYGLKAVAVPHAIYLEQGWPAQALDFIFNNGDQNLVPTKNGRSFLPNQGSGGPESVFGWEREHNWDRSTWYYKNRLAERLYKRWLGWEIDGIGGHEWERRNGRYCLPPMLLHPIKSVEDAPAESS